MGGFKASLSNNYVIEYGVDVTGAEDAVAEDAARVESMGGGLEKATTPNFKSRESVTLAMDPSAVDLVSSSGAALSIAQRAALPIALQVLNQNYKASETLFLGKIQTKTNDYLIAAAVHKAFNQPKTYFFSTDAVSWAQLPKVTKEMIEDCDKLPNNLLFTGDISFILPVPAAPPTEEAAEEPAEPRTLTEEGRLAVLVERIDREVAIAPKGALTKSSNLKDLCRAPSFVMQSDGGDLESYVLFHQLKPSSLLSELEDDQVQDASLSADAFDPKGTLCIHHDVATGCYTVRNLLWPGAFGFVKPGTNVWGYCYFGTGLKNTDLAFMLP